jgi:hypothetical protein
VALSGLILLAHPDTVDLIRGNAVANESADLFAVLVDNFNCICDSPARSPAWLGALRSSALAVRHSVLPGSGC